MAIADKKLQGQVAVVTGASRGIGLAMCEALAYEGCNLAITARNAAGILESGCYDPFGNTSSVFPKPPALPQRGAGLSEKESEKPRRLARFQILQLRVGLGPYL